MFLIPALSLSLYPSHVGHLIIMSSILDITNERETIKLRDVERWRRGNPSHFSSILSPGFSIFPSKQHFSVIYFSFPVKDTSTTIVSISLPLFILPTLCHYWRLIPNTRWLVPFSVSHHSGLHSTLLLPNMSLTEFLSIHLIQGLNGEK